MSPVPRHFSFERIPLLEPFIYHIEKDIYNFTTEVNGPDFQYRLVLDVVCFTELPDLWKRLERWSSRKQNQNPV